VKRANGAWIFPTILLALGVTALTRGFRAWQTGRIFPPNAHGGWMTGPQVVFVGVLICVLAIWTWIAAPRE